MADTSPQQAHAWKPIDLEKTASKAVEALHNQTTDASGHRQSLGHSKPSLSSEPKPSLTYKLTSVGPSIALSADPRAKNTLRNTGVNNGSLATKSTTLNLPSPNPSVRLSPDTSAIMKPRAAPKTRATRTPRSTTKAPAKQPPTKQTPASRKTPANTSSRASNSRASASFSSAAAAATGPSLAPTTRSATSGRTPLTSTAPTKRKRGAPSDDEDGSSDDLPPAKKRASTAAGKRPDVKARGHGLACPFYRYDPIGSRECREFLLTKISYVKQHITRHHRRPAFCPLCMEEFEDEDELQEHVRAQNCSKKEYMKPRGVTEDQLKRLRGRVDQKKNVEDQWYDIYRILFPGAERPKSVYVDHDISPDVGDYVGYLLHQFNEKVPLLFGLEEQRFKVPPPPLLPAGTTSGTAPSVSGKEGPVVTPGMASTQSPLLTTAAGTSAAPFRSMYAKSGPATVDIADFKDSLQQETRKMYTDWCHKKKSEAETARRNKKIKRKDKKRMARRRQAAENESVAGSSSEESELGDYEYDFDDQWPIAAYDDDDLTPEELQKKQQDLQLEFQQRQQLMYTQQYYPSSVDPAPSTSTSTSTTSSIPKQPPSQPPRFTPHGHLPPLQSIPEHWEPRQISPPMPPPASPAYHAGISRPGLSRAASAAELGRQTSPKNEEANGPARKEMAIESLLGPTHPR